jgi:hypothetical protein
MRRDVGGRDGGHRLREQEGRAVRDHDHVSADHHGSDDHGSVDNGDDVDQLRRAVLRLGEELPRPGRARPHVADAYKSLASAAPAEIRSDFQTFANAFSDYAKALDKSGFKPGKTPTASQIAAITAASKEFSSPKLLTAERHLTAWGQQNCAGVTTTTG